MDRIIRIGTRESQLAVWQAATVKELLSKNGYKAELVYIKSEGDTDLKTPLYEIGVQGIFTRALDIALLNDEIDRRRSWERNGKTRPGRTPRNKRLAR